ncbi:FAD-dependent oxidoreductase [Mycobacterium sp. M1]|uniref:FAD-dependent oxidoreductase n=1 Tax=Mycolicibacter acidiphilus TaxID=2835306 RepID=A0ABS5REF7_9MYCO|nr:FAD-dependent oxidoreductase [Mycolicibacter acidiphilus]MBS9532670.1 FAD-dependent oxidoreductase [Mycolicibacter acidiphilus]
MPNVIVIGSGFAGLWAALGAARRLDELCVTPGEVNVTVLSDKPFHDIRVRNYEPDLRDCRIPLDDLLTPAGVAHVTATVTGIDAGARTVTTADGTVHRYDRLVLAAGSRAARPDAPGFDVDTFDGAVALDAHLRDLARHPSPGAATVVVVGAGLTGIETACELPGRLTALFGSGAAPRVVLVDHTRIGSDMGDSARPVIEEALSDNGVETRTGVRVTGVDADRVTLSSGETLAAATVVWCTGMRASTLTDDLPVARDRFGRVAVDDYLRVVGVTGVFAAGDVAAATMDDEHLSVMSCQHSRPMGRFAGYNVISDLLGEPMLPLRIPWYVTVLDLGPAGAVYTQGWDRAVAAQGAAAKAVKREINTHRIYPPRDGDRAALLAAAAPLLQDQPDLGY